MKHQISVIIPAISPLEGAPVIQSFLDAGVQDGLFVQFVYLHNSKKIVPDDTSTIHQYGTHDVLYVANDRYFGSCEENIFRVQDFIDLLMPFSVVVGEHDIIDWPLLMEALAFRDANKLEALSWNVLSKQRKPNGNYSSLPLLCPVGDTGSANQLVKMLFGGQVLDSSIAYPAMMSLYGTMYWVSYVGNHLFSLACLRSLLQYAFTEHLCSQVYKQAEFFSSHSVRYGYFNKPVVHRVGEEFIKMHNNNMHWGWIEDHRTVFGNSAAFQIAHVMHLYQIESDALFNLIATSLGLSNTPAAECEQGYGRFAMMTEMLAWSADVIRHKLTSRSHYFPEVALKGTLQDLRYIKLLFARLLRNMETTPAVFHVLDGEFKRVLIEVVNYLTSYLTSLHAGEELLALAHERLGVARSLLGGDTLNTLNQLAFTDYLSRKNHLV